MCLIGFVGEYLFTSLEDDEEHRGKNEKHQQLPCK